LRLSGVKEKNINKSRIERTLHLHHQQNESSGKEKIKQERKEGKKK